MVTFWHALPMVLLAGTVFAALNLARFDINIGIIERPLFIGFVWSLVFSDFELALGAALFFELFWIDLIPAGTFIPPNALLTTLCALTTCSVLGLDTARDAAPVLAVCLPLGWLGGWIESLQRTWNNRAYNALLLSSSQGRDFSPQKLIVQGLSQKFATGLLLFFACQAAVLAVLPLPLAWWKEMSSNIPLEWPFLWLSATIGPVLSLRHRQPRIAFFAAFLILGVIIYFLPAAFSDGPPWHLGN